MFESNLKRFLHHSSKRTVDNRISHIVSSRKGARSSNDGSKLPSIRPKTTGSLIRNLDDIVAREMYEEKCNELEIPQNEIAEKKFVEQFTKSITTKSLRLQNFGLVSSSIEKLIKSLGESCFYVIDISLNRLTDKGAFSIAKYISKNPSLIYLDLRSNGISINGSYHIFLALVKNYHLTHLNMSTIDGINRNRIGVKGCESLAFCLKTNQVLSYLNVASCGINAEGCEMIGQIMPLNSGLIELDLSSNAFGTHGAECLLKANNCFGDLEFLNLSNNDIGAPVGKILSSQLSSNRTLKHIDLSNNTIGPAFLGCLQQALEKGCVLESLSISNNHIDMSSCSSIELILRTKSKLKKLNLSMNPLGDKMIEKIVASMNQNDSFDNLDFSDTKIGDEGAVCFASYIHKSQKLHVLKLSNNVIKDKGGVALADSIRNNTTLIELVLRNNEMKDQAGNAFSEALNCNKTINILDLDYNDFSYKGLQVIRTQISEHRKVLETNIPEIAKQHITELAVEEKKFHDFSTLLVEASQKKDEKNQELEKQKLKLEKLKELRYDQISQNKELIAKLTQKLETISSYKSRKNFELISLREEIETTENNLTEQYQNIALKYQQAKSRHHIYETKKKEIFISTNQKLDDLKMNLCSTKKELFDTIQEAQKKQQDLIVLRDQLSQITPLEQIKNLK